MSHVLERRRSHSPGEARCAVVQQPGHACSWRSKAGLVYFWHSAFSHKRNAFKKHIHSSLSLFVSFIFLYSFSLSSIFFYSSYLIILSCYWILPPFFYSVFLSPPAQKNVWLLENFIFPWTEWEMKINLSFDLDGSEVQDLVRVCRQVVGLKPTGYFWSAISEQGRTHSYSILVKTFKLKEPFERQRRVWLSTWSLFETLLSRRAQSGRWSSLG